MSVQSIKYVVVCAFYLKENELEVFLKRCLSAFPEANLIVVCNNGLKPKHIERTYYLLGSNRYFEFSAYMEALNFLLKEFFVKCGREYDNSPIIFLNDSIIRKHCLGAIIYSARRTINSLKSDLYYCGVPSRLVIDNNEKISYYPTYFILTNIKTSILLLENFIENPLRNYCKLSSILKFTGYKKWKPASSNFISNNKLIKKKFCIFAEFFFSIQAKNIQIEKSVSSIFLIRFTRFLIKSKNYLMYYIH